MRVDADRGLVSTRSLGRWSSPAAMLARRFMPPENVPMRSDPRATTIKGLGDALAQHRTGEAVELPEERQVSTAERSG